MLKLFRLAVAILLLAPLGASAHPPPVSDAEGAAALAICKQHFKPHGNLNFEDGWRHCGRLAKLLWARGDHAEMNAPTAAAEEAANPDLKMTRDVLRRLEATDGK